MREGLKEVGLSVAHTVTGTFRFGGRSRIADVIYFWGAMCLARLVAMPLADLLAWDAAWWTGQVIGFLVGVPCYALLGRRLHDQGHSAWWVLISLPLAPLSFYQSYRVTFAAVNPEWLDQPLPFDNLMPWMMAVALVFLFLFFWPGQKGQNRYGPDPRDVA